MSVSEIHVAVADDVILFTEKKIEWDQVQARGGRRVRFRAKGRRTAAVFNHWPQDLVRQKLQNLAGCGENWQGMNNGTHMDDNHYMLNRWSTSRAKTVANGWNPGAEHDLPAGLGISMAIWMSSSLRSLLPTSVKHEGVVR